MRRPPARLTVTAGALALAAACAAPAARPVRLAPIADTAPFRFVALGDSRGFADGTARPIFLAMLDRVAAESPQLVVHTGDLINGYSSDEALLRRQWRAYQAQVARLGAPIFHAPGNHDIFSELSGRLWRETLGETYYAFDHGPARFIVLDTETERSRIGARQFEWLRERLATAGPRHVFIVLHQPLFPTGAQIGGSLDARPADRDPLHALLAAHRAQIRAVFQGHEHLYHFEERDGVPYYIVAGAGAELYAPPELGGYHHYLVVDVSPTGVSITLRRMVADSPAPPAVPVAPGAVLESWEDPAFWYSWDNAVIKRPTRGRASDGRQGLEVFVDFSLSPDAVLYTLLAPPRSLRGAASIAVDVFAPAELAGLRIAAAVRGRERYAAPPVTLQAGWNALVTDLTAAWLPAAERDAARQVEWVLSGGPPRTSSVVFDNVRVEGRGDGAARWSESWEQPLVWGAGSPDLVPEPTASPTTDGARALRVPYAFGPVRRQVLYTAPAPAWNLRDVSALALDVYAPPPDAGLVRVSLALGGRAGRYESPAGMLRPGWNPIRVPLDAWLPDAVRADVDRVEWIFSSTGRDGRGALVLDRFRATTDN